MILLKNIGPREVELLAKAHNSICAKCGRTERGCECSDFDGRLVYVFMCENASDYQSVKMFNNNPEMYNMPVKVGVFTTDTIITGLLDVNQMSDEHSKAAIFDFVDATHGIMSYNGIEAILAMETYTQTEAYLMVHGDGGVVEEYASDHPSSVRVIDYTNTNIFTSDHVSILPRGIKLMSMVRTALSERASMVAVSVDIKSTGDWQEVCGLNGVDFTKTQLHNYNLPQTTGDLLHFILNTTAPHIFICNTVAEFSSLEEEDLRVISEVAKWANKYVYFYNGEVE